MSFLQRVDVTVLTDAASAANVNSPPISGYVEAVAFTPATADPWSTAADFVLTAGISLQDILHVDLNSSLGGMYYPRGSANTTSSGAFDQQGNASGLVPVRRALARESVNIVVSSGGAAKTGTVRLYVDGMGG